MEITGFAIGGVPPLLEDQVGERLPAIMDRQLQRFEEVWAERAPLGWNVRDPEAVARACVCLLSDWFPLTTGEILHVDGGFHAVGA